MNKAIFAAGCFWGVEYSFSKLNGVISTRVGYCGGEKENPSYEDVCSGKTGHAEAIEITFDPKILSYQELLNHFWNIHDPTTINRQGPDIGTQYRSVIFYLDEEQKKAAINLRESLNSKKILKKPIVTEIVKASTFYEAEEYHQSYYLKKE